MAIQTTDTDSVFAEWNTSQSASLLVCEKCTVFVDLDKGLELL